MRTIMFALVLVLLAAPAQAQQTIIRDANGRITTTVTTDSNGTRTFRDGSGRTTGTANSDANGTITFRDAGGRMTGTATSPRDRR
jgi:YD repeat-containing protein